MGGPYLIVGCARDHMIFSSSSRSFVESKLEVGYNSNAPANQKLVFTCKRNC